jgi:hypothetical protein
MFSLSMFNVRYSNKSPLTLALSPSDGEREKITRSHF